MNSPINSGLSSDFVLADTKDSKEPVKLDKERANALLKTEERGPEKYSTNYCQKEKCPGNLWCIWLIYQVANSEETRKEPGYVCQTCGVFYRFKGKYQKKEPVCRA